MGPVAIALLVFGYSLMSCLMMALWSHIPPHRPFSDIMTGLLWPCLLPMMILAAFINATVRALTDQDGQFAGLLKDSTRRKNHLGDGQKGA